MSDEECFFMFCCRSALIQEATSKNQDFQNAVHSLDFFLVNLPNNAIKPTDDAAQIAAKENSQKVSGRNLFTYINLSPPSVYKLIQDCFNEDVTLLCLISCGFWVACLF